MSPRNENSRNNRGFTLVEALVAASVLAIIAVGTLRVVTSIMKSTTASSDRMKKVGIAQARLEEHKAKYYGEYVPDMPIHVIKPVPGTGTSAYQVDFAGNTIYYRAQKILDIDCTTDSITTGAGYEVLTPTPNPTPCQYYGDVSSFSHMAWASPLTRDSCDNTPGSLSFDIKTPPNVGGNLVLTFADYAGQNRSQSVWLDGVLQRTYKPDASDVNLRMSKTPTAPTTLNIPFNRFDTHDGLLQVNLMQEGVPNDWGFLLENGTNQRGYTILGCSLTPIVATPTRTPTPAAGVCIPYTGNWVEAEAMTRSNFQLSSTGGGQEYVYPNTNGGTGYASYMFSVTCTGVYEVEGAVRANANHWNSSFDPGENSLGVEIPNATPVFLTPVALWETTNYNSWVTTSVSHRGNSAYDQYPQYKPAQWVMNPGTYTIYFRKAEADRYLRMRRFRINLVAVPTPTPTATGSPVAVATPTRTPTPGSCTFSGRPVTLSVNSYPTYAYGVPTYVSAYGCKQNDVAMAVTGLANSSGMVYVRSATILTDGPDETPTPGYYVDRTGQLKAQVRLEANMSVTMIVTGRCTSGAVTVSAFRKASSAGWYEVSTADLGWGGCYVMKVDFDFAGASTSTINRILIDGIRFNYSVVENPNAVLTGANISVMDSLWDYSTYAPRYVVESVVQPGERPGASKGFIVKVRVYNGKNYRMVTPTPGPGVLPTPVPYMDIDTRFPPVEVSNSVSP